MRLTTRKNSAELRPFSRRASIARGAILMSAVSVMMRVLSLAAQLVLGRVLLDVDFGLYALALSLTVIATALRSVLQPVLVEMLEKNTEGYRRTYRTAMTCVWILTVVGVLLSRPISRYLNQPDLEPLLAVLLLLMPLQVLPTFGLARLNHQLKFSTVGRVLTISTLARYSILVLAALVGLGPFSFAASTAAAMGVEYFALRSHLRVVPGVFSRQTILDARASFGRFVHSSENRRWIWLSAIALSLATSGDYIAASTSLDPNLIGLYFFAYSVVGAFSGPLSHAVNTVLVPGFVALPTVEAKRLRLSEVIAVTTVIGVLLFNSAMVLIAPIVNLLWDGKWDESIPVMIGFLILAPLQALHVVSLAIARGSGYWNLYFSAILAAGVTIVIAAGLGASTGSLLGLVAAVVLADTAVMFSTLARLTLRLRGSLLVVARHALLPWFLGVPALAVAHAVHPLDDPDLVPSLSAAVAFGAVTIALVGLPYRRLLLELGGLVTRRPR